MCYTVATPKKSDLKKVLSPAIVIKDYQPYYYSNGFDHPDLPVITSQDRQVVKPLEWGLIPNSVSHSSEIETFQKQANLLNARSEEVFIKKSFRDYIPSQRCLIFVNGFFEYKHLPNNEKEPFFMYMPDQLPFAFAGLYNNWYSPAENLMKETCTILTTEADELMASIHNSAKRMPLILPQAKWAKWLDESLSQLEIEGLMARYDEGKLIAHPVSRKLMASKGNRNVKAIQEKHQELRTGLLDFPE